MGPLIDDLVAEQHALNAALAGVPDAHWERPVPAEGGVLRDGIAHLTEGDERTRCVAETRRPLWPLWPLSPSPGRTPRRGALNGRQVDARARSGAERVDWWADGT